MKNIGLLVLLILIGFSCGTNKKAASKSQVIEVRSLDELDYHIKRGNLNITLDSTVRYKANKTVYVTSGVHINGQGAKIKMDYSKGNFNLFEGLGKSGIIIENIEVIGDNCCPQQYKQSVRDVFVFRFRQCTDLIFENINVAHHAFSAFYLEDVKSVDVINCHIEDLGYHVASNDYPNYSYDGILLTGFYGTNDILISNCSFSEIDGGDYDLYSDGDGVQIWSKKPNVITNVTIDSCSFFSCARRGIKIQSGNNIDIINSNFDKCRSAIGHTMQNSPDDILIDNCKVTNGNIGVAFNSSTEIFANNISITNSHFTNLNYFSRNSGKSKTSNLVIDNCKIDSINYCVLDNRVEGLMMKNNVVSNFAMLNDKSYYMALLLASGSKDISVVNNTWYANKKNRMIMYLQNVDQSKFANNTIKAISDEKINPAFVHNSKQRQAVNSLKNNNRIIQYKDKGN